MLLTRLVAIKGRMPPLGGTTLPGWGRLAETSVSLAMQYVQLCRRRLVAYLPLVAFRLLQAR